MNSERPIPVSCQTALAALELAPLELPEPVQAHVRTCLACAEARVLWLALEEAPEVEVAPDYFAGLSFRILRKLPAGKVVRHSASFWLAAAGLLAALGLGATGFYLGQAVRQPMVEAAQPKPLAEPLEGSNETPFYETEETLTQLSDLSPQQAETALLRLQGQEPASAGK